VPKAGGVLGYWKSPKPVALPKKRRKQEREERKIDLKYIDTYRVYRPGTGWCANRVHHGRLIREPYGYDRGLTRALFHRDQSGLSQLM
jgi:hypothetical protein